MKNGYKISSVISRTALRFLLFAGILVLVAILASYFERSAKQPGQTFTRFQKQLQKQREWLRADLTKISSIMPGDLFETNRLTNEDPAYKTFFVYTNDSMVFWGTQSVELPLKPDSVLLQSDFISTSNGLFLLEHVKKDENHYIGLSLICTLFPYENEYLVNHFNPVYKLSQAVSVSFKTTGFDVFSANEAYAFSLEFAGGSPRPDWFVLIQLALYVSVLLFIISALHEMYKGMFPFFKSKKGNMKCTKACSRFSNQNIGFCWPTWLIF